MMNRIIVEAFLSLLEYEQPNHPFHSTVAAAGLEHDRSFKFGNSTNHVYTPDHHLKSTIVLSTKNKGGKVSHSWKDQDHPVGGNDIGTLKAHLEAGQKRFDARMNHVKQSYDSTIHGF